MKAGGYLRRRTPLARGGRIKRKSPRRIAKETPREKAYKAWIHTQVCVGRLAFPETHRCVGEAQQSHERNPPGGMPTGGGRKEGALMSIASCWLLHMLEWTPAAGHFKDWSKEKRHDFMAQWIGYYNAAFALETGAVEEGS